MSTSLGLANYSWYSRIVSYFGKFTPDGTSVFHVDELTHVLIALRKWLPICVWLDDQCTCQIGSLRLLTDLASL